MRDGRFEAVVTGSRLSANALDRVLACLGDFFIGAAAGVLGLGLGPQVGVGELGVARLRGRGRAAPGRRRPASSALLPPWAPSSVGGGEVGVVRVHRLDVRRIPSIEIKGF